MTEQSEQHWNENDVESACISKKDRKRSCKNKKKKSVQKLDRDSWESKWDFLFSCISVSVGLGNVWRFPYLCFKHGGGAFLVCYFVSMFFCGVPLFFQEVALGQYLGSGGMTLVGKLCPILSGTGYATMTIVFLLDVYYCIICAWTLFYLVTSFYNFSSLPWKGCDNWWNTIYCSTAGTGASLNGTINLMANTSESIIPLIPRNVSLHRTPAEDYWLGRVLMITDGIDSVGGMQWDLLLGLFISWFIIYAVLGKGLSESGKVVWFTAIFPYFIMGALLVRAITLDGAWNGLTYLVSTDWSKLKSAETWMDGVTQIFFGYSLGVGTLPALGSYNSFEHNCYRDAVITCIVNTLTCLLSSVVTFSILGFMAFSLGTQVENVVSSGPGLVFVTYPEVVLKLPSPALWAIIFFLMLAIIGLDSAFCNVESFITGLVDKWSTVLRPRRRLFAFCVCCFMFLLGIPMVTKGGMYVFQLFDFYSASGLCLLWVCFFQTIAVSWFYGASKFCGCVEQMLGYRPNYFLYICWVALAPLTMVAVFIFFVVKFEPVKYGNNYIYPKWGEYLGLFISGVSMIWIPLYALYYLYKEPGTLLERLKRGTTPQTELLATRRVTKPKVEPMSEELLPQTNNPQSDSKVVLLSSQAALT